MTLGTLVLIIIGLVWIWLTIRAIRWMCGYNNIDGEFAGIIILANIAFIIIGILCVLIEYGDVVLF